MPIDVRGYTAAIGPTGTLGRVVSGQIGDSYITGGVGLVKTSGHIVVQGFNSLQPGTRVTISTGFPKGNSYRIPRFLRVLSSCIIPQDRTTRIELGCRLKYFEEAADDVVVHHVLGIVPTSLAASQPENFSASISASTVASACASRIGASLTSTPSMVFYRQFFDISSGYVNVLDKLLASAGLVGFMTTDTSIKVVSANLSRMNGGRSLGANSIISVTPLGIGQRPAERVSVSYNSLEIKSDDGLEQTETEWLSSWTANFSRSTTTSLSSVVVPYQNQETGQQDSITYDVRDNTSEESTYEERNGRNVLTKRVQTETKSSVAVAGAVVTDYLSAGVRWNSGMAESTTTETFNYDANGREIRRVLIRDADRLYGLGSLGLPMTFPSTDPEAPGGVDLVPIPGGKMQLERIVTNTIRAGGFQKTITRRYGPWIQTPMGQQTIAEAREYFDTAQKVVDFINLALDGSFLLDVTVSTQRDTNSEEAAPSVWEVNLPNLVSDEAPAQDNYRGEQITESIFAIGGVGSGVVLALNLVIPYADDDRLIRIPPTEEGGETTYRVQKGDQAGQAKLYGQVYNSLLVGMRYGLGVQVAVSRMPPEPFSPMAISIAGTAGAFRANGLSWTISNDGIVGSIDALFAGGIGGPNYSFPIADGVSAPTTLPEESNDEPVEILGTVEGVGATPQDTLNAEFPEAVIGDGVQDTISFDYWVYSGAEWVNVGPNPGPTVETTPLPIFNTTDLVRPRSRHRVVVQSWDYAFILPLREAEVTSRHRINVIGLQATAVPAATISIAGVAPNFGAQFQMPVANVTVEAQEPSVISSAILSIPAAEISVSVAGDLLVVIGTALPAADITVTGLAPTVGPEEDPDAATWLNAVEAEDGSSLEAGLRLAVNNFVVGCKDDGIWAAMQSVVILAGARTLAGALIPLKGSAPTNHGFIGADYDRKLGLLGDGSSYLDANRAGNADAQNSKHFAVYLNSTVQAVVGGNRAAPSNPGATYLDTQGSPPFAVRCRIHTALTTNDTFSIASAPAGFLAGSRSGASSGTIRYGATGGTGITTVSETPQSETILLFARRNSTTGDPESFSTHQIAMYSIGANLNVELYRARINTLMADIAAAIP